MPRPEGGKITDRLLKMFGKDSDGWNPPRGKSGKAEKPKPPAAGYKLGRGAGRKKES